jgi:non-specific serine/threonine protein kinase
VDERLGPERATREPASRRKHHLPCEVSSVVGRESEIAELKVALAETRLLTLTGAAGVGKTRLALRVAADLVRDYSGRSSQRGSTST